MANIKSAKKRILQSNKKRLLNKSVKSEIKTEIKKIVQLLHTATTQTSPSEHNNELLLQQLQKVEKIVDKAAGKKVMHKNKAARIKSNLRRQYNTIVVPLKSVVSEQKTVAPEVKDKEVKDKEVKDKEVKNKETKDKEPIVQESIAQESASNEIDASSVNQ